MNGHIYQFIKLDFMGLLKDNGIQISVKDKGWWRDNVFVVKALAQCQIMRRFIYMPATA